MKLRMLCGTLLVIVVGLVVGPLSLVHTPPNYVQKVFARSDDRAARVTVQYQRGQPFVTLILTIDSDAVADPTLIHVTSPEVWMPSIDTRLTPESGEYLALTFDVVAWEPMSFDAARHVAEGMRVVTERGGLRRDRTFSYWTSRADDGPWQAYLEEVAEYWVGEWSTVLDAWHRRYAAV